LESTSLSVPFAAFRDLLHEFEKKNQTDRRSIGNGALGHDVDEIRKRIAFGLKFVMPPG
jgi:hypothetical protein